MAAQSSTTVQSWTRHVSSSSIREVLEEDDPQVNNDILQLSTPRDIPQLEGDLISPVIDNTLFDVLEVSVDSHNNNVHRACTAKSRNPLMMTVDYQGVFQMEVLFCRCLSRKMSKDEKVMRVGLFPATLKQTETLFTFFMLDNFLTDNLNCKTTAQQYYSKLQSMTSSMFLDHFQWVKSLFLYFMLTHYHRINTNSYWGPHANGEISRTGWRVV